MGFVLSVYFLIAGSDWLGQALSPSSSLTMGGLVAWVAYLSLSFGIYFSYPALMFPLSGFERFMKTGWMLLALLALLWPLISYLLAGNWAFNFSSGSEFQGSETAFWLFVYFSAFLGISLLIWPLLIVGNLLFRKSS
jgi:hypothetical protein